MAVATTPSPELELLGRTVGLIDADGAVRPTWFGQPWGPLATVLSDADQRRALFELLQLILDRPGPTIDHPDGHTLGDETWLPIAVDDTALPPAPGLYLVIRESGSGPDAGSVTLSVGVLTRHAGQDPLIGLTARLPLLRFDAAADDEGLQVLIGTSEASLDLEFELAFATPAGPIRALRVGATIPTAADGRTSLRLSVLTGTGERSVGTGDDPAEVQEALFRLLLELITSHEAEPTRQLTHLLSLLGLLDDEHIPSFPLQELLGEGRDAWSDWLRELLTAPESRTAAFEHLAGLLELEDELLSGSGTPEDPLRLQLLTAPADVAVTLVADLDGDVPVVTLGAGASATTTGDGRRGTARLRGDIVRVRFGHRPEVTLAPDLELTGRIDGDGGPLVDLDGQAPPVAVDGLVAGLARDHEAGGIRLVLQARGVSVGPNRYPVLDLTDVDALVAVGTDAADDLLATLTGAVDVTDEGRALGVLLGLADPPGRTDDWDHRLSLATLLSDPGRAIVEVHRSAMASDDWGAMADALAALLWTGGEAPPRAGSGTADDPWLTPVVDEPTGTLTLVTWTASQAGSGGAGGVAGGPALHVAIRLQLPASLGATELSLDLDVGLLRLQLGSQGGPEPGSEEGDLDGAAVTPLPDARARFRAAGGLDLGGERLRLHAEVVAIGARWERGDELQPSLDVDGLTLHVDGDDQPLELPRFAPDDGWRYDGEPPWELLEALLTRLLEAVDDERWRELPRLLRWRGAPPASVDRDAGEDPADAPESVPPLPRLPLRELVEEPVEALRVWLLDALTGDHAQQAADLARAIVTRVLAPPDRQPLRGSGARDDPWRVPLGTSRAELTVTVPRPRPGVLFTELLPDAVVDAAADAADAPADAVATLGGLLAELTALDPQLAEALRHLPDTAVADRLVRLRAVLDAGDGLVAATDQAPPGSDHVEVEVTGVLHLDALDAVDAVAHLPSGAGTARRVVVVPAVAGLANLADLVAGVGIDASRVVELTDPNLPAAALDLSDLDGDGPWVLVLPTPTSVPGGHADVAERLRRALEVVGGAVAEPLHVIAHGVAGHAARAAIPAAGVAVGHLVTVAAPSPGSAPALDDDARAAVRLLVSARGLVTDPGSTLVRIADGLAALVDGAPPTDDGPPRADRVTSEDLAGPDAVPPLPDGTGHTAIVVRLGTDAFDRALAQLVVGLHAGMLDRLAGLGPDDPDERELRLGLRAHLRRPPTGATGVRVSVDADATLGTVLEDPAAVPSPAAASTLRIRLDRADAWLVTDPLVRVRAVDLLVELGGDPAVTLVLHDAVVHGVRRTRWRLDREDALEAPSELRTLLRRVIRTLDDAPDAVAELLTQLGVATRDAAGELDALVEPLLEVVADPTVVLGRIDRVELAATLDELLAPGTPSPDPGVVVVPLGDHLDLRIDLELERVTLTAAEGARFGGLRVTGELDADAEGLGVTATVRSGGGSAGDGGGPRLDFTHLPAGVPSVALRWPDAPGTLPTEIALVPDPATEALEGFAHLVAPVEVVRAVLDGLAERSAPFAALLEAFGLRAADRVRVPLRLLVELVDALTAPEALGDAAGRVDAAAIATVVARLADLLPIGGSSDLDGASASARLSLPGDLELLADAGTDGRARVRLGFADGAVEGDVALSGGVAVRAASDGGVATTLELGADVQADGPQPGITIVIGAGASGAGPAGAEVTLRLAGASIPVVPPGQGIAALSNLSSAVGDAALHALPLALDALADADDPVGGIVRGLGDATGLRTSGGFDRDAIADLVDEPVERFRQRLASAADEVLDELLEALRALAAEVLPDGLPVALGDVEGAPAVIVELELDDLDGGDTGTVTVSLHDGRPRIEVAIAGLEAVDGFAFDLGLAVREGVERFAAAVRIVDPDRLRVGGVSLHPQVSVTAPAGTAGAGDAGDAAAELGLTLFTSTDTPRRGATARLRFAPAGFAVGGVTDDGSADGDPASSDDLDDLDVSAALEAVLTELLVPLSANLALAADPVRELLDATGWSGGPSVGEVLDTHLLTRDGADGPYALVPRALELDGLPDRLLGVGARLLAAIDIPFPGMDPVTLGIAEDDGRLGLSVGLTPGRRLELFDTGEVRLAVEVDDGWFDGTPGTDDDAGSGLQLLLVRFTEVAGQLPEVAFEPAVRLRGLGLRLDRPGDGPLVDLGVRLDALAVHALWDADIVPGSDSAPGALTTLRAGLHLRAHGLAVPLASEDGSNAVAAGLLAQDGGEGDSEVLRPTFSPSLALLFEDDGPRLRFRAGEGEGPWWLPIQRGFGPLYVEQVGIGRTLDARGDLDEVQVLLDGGASLAGLSVGVRELGLVLPWESLHDASTWRVTLAGLAVAYDSAGVQIAGGLRKREIRAGGELVGVDYVGMLRVAFPPYGLTAFGGFGSFLVTPDGTERYSSLFVFGALSAPLGGPAAFFVTGIGAGAGLNRRLVAPTSITEVPRFPLVAALDPASPLARDPMGAVDQLGETFPPSRGALWFAAGLSFTSFALVDSIAMLTVEIDDGLEINLLGLARMELPDALAPIAAVELALQARFSTREGVLSIQAQLTDNSWIITRECRLTGGFAFVVWFAGAHAGQFVLTLGGYHPEFARPPEFPVPPRLGFAWTPTDDITIKGGAYFALTASCVMAGGDLEISYDGGWVWASLRAGAHLLVAWDPFAFTAEFYVEIRAGVEFRVCFFKCATVRKSFSFGVRLRLEGPELRGRATIDLSVITVEVRFGATGAPRRPDPLGWNAFAARYLDADTRGDPQVLSAAVTSGLDDAGPAEEPAGEDAPAHGSRNRPWRVTPEFAMVVETTVMTRHLRWRNPGGDWNHRPDDLSSAKRSIVPMAAALGDSVLTVTLSGGSVDLDPAPRSGLVPEGLWGVVPIEDDPPAEANMLPTLSGLAFDTRVTDLPDDGVVTTVIDDEDVGVPRRNPLALEASQSAPGGRFRDLRELDERVHEDLVTELGPILLARSRDRLVPGRIGTLFDGIADPERDRIEVPIAGAVEATPPVARELEATVHLDAVLPVEAAAVPQFSATRSTSPRVPAPTLVDAHRNLEVVLPAHLDVVERPAVKRGDTLVAADPVPRPRVAALGRERLSSSLGGDTDLAERVGRIDGRAVGRSGQKLRSDQVAVWEVRDAGDATSVVVTDAPARVLAVDATGGVLLDATVDADTSQAIPAGAHRVVTAAAPGTGLVGGWTADEELPYVGAGTFLAGGALLSVVTGPWRRGPGVVRAATLRAADVVRRGARATTRLAGDVTAVAIAVDGSTEDLDVRIRGAEVSGDEPEPVEILRGGRTWLVLEVAPAGEDAVHVEVRLPEGSGALGGVLGGVLGADELAGLLDSGGQQRVRVPLATEGAGATIRWEGANRAT